MNLFLNRVMESVWFILIGLFFDIVGAALVVKPILHWRKWTYERVVNDAIAQQRGMGKEIEKRNKDRRNSWIGFSLLAFGFILQIIGNFMRPG